MKANSGAYLLSFILLSVIFSTCGLIYNAISKPAIKVDKQTQNDLENIIYLETKYGRVVINLLPEKAPNHVKRIKELCRQHFYDGLTFHRVIEDFMVQGGDPKGNGTGGSGKKISAEFSDLMHTRGAVSMARANDPNSADSQFFIVTKDSLFLDGKYTIWGHVISGMEYIDALKKGDSRKDNGLVENPDKIISMAVAIDAEKAKLAK